MGSGIRTMVGAILCVLAAACGPDEQTVLRSFSADWIAEDAAGGVRLRLAPEGGVLVGLGTNGSALDTMEVDVVDVDPDTRTVYLRRIETDVEFAVEGLEPADDGRARLRLRFPNSRDVHLVFRRPLPDES